MSVFKYMIPLDLGREMARCRYKKAGLHPIYTHKLSPRKEKQVSLETGCDRALQSV